MPVVKPSKTIRPEDKNMSVDFPGARIPAQVNNPQLSPAQFIPRNEPMELCREYMRQRAWMVSRIRGMRITEEDVQRTLDKLFGESEPLKRPLPRDVSVPEGYERSRSGIIAPIEKEKEEPDLAELEKNFQMWNKLWLCSAILLFTVNICVGIFKSKWPIGFIPLAPFLFTLYKRQKAQKKYDKLYWEEDM